VPHHSDVLLVITLAAALVAFSGIATGAAAIAKLLFCVFLLMFIVSMIEVLIRNK